MKDPVESGFRSPLLNDIIFSFPALRKSINELLQTIRLKQAADGRKDDLWFDQEKYPAIEETRMVGSFAFKFQRQC